MMIHLSVGAIIFYSKNVQHIVLLYRKKTDTYHLPKGTVEEQEHIMQTLHREIREETNLDIDIQKFVTDAKSSFFRDEKEIPYAMELIRQSYEFNKNR
ncbi:MAG: hypothetical protein COU30_02980 [Candidatus Magasanikbacteria bacterium CG10_big_fil_rev_8_21_14_0_10_38_6]|uniref:Nudix hydrolase domain-containing protein n=1 Tax=Candidatus Magasanikbacteria bacterium CG10_big_fil_rev_8_21_14_0_10_38_6 TaxID=1974647 RepID=A0A2M6P0Z5_9BACT|nr:MAG: hypothetical protein COU30_02980 [Candidatus Magasanikbacteria bacterium CG10_big_fil_rev_8_21_14_0_10_38_6]